ncbi:hypothetical protein BH11PAT1_BH11PAT1_2380 [soil metagenome]
MTQKSQVNPVAVGLVGVVAGAVGAAVAMTLSDDEKKKQVEKKYNQVRSDVNKTVNQWVEKAKDMQKQSGDSVDDIKTTATTKTDEILEKADVEISKLEEAAEKKDLAN